MPARNATGSDVQLATHVPASHSDGRRVSCTVAAVVPKRLRLVDDSSQITRTPLLESTHRKVGQSRLKKGQKTTKVGEGGVF